MSTNQHNICHSLYIKASPEEVWQHITEVDIASFPHSPVLYLLGIPKPLRAEIPTPGVGGCRIAHFGNGKKFLQQITAWEQPSHYAFTFQAEKGFRVGFFFDLATGPFRMCSGEYVITPTQEGVDLKLCSNYALYGFIGFFIKIPVWLVLFWFQKYLLRGLKSNAERDNA